METGKLINLGRRGKLLGAQDNTEDFEQYRDKIKKVNQKEVTFFFLTELLGKYGYKAVIKSIDQNSSDRNPEDPLDNSIQMLTDKFGKEVFQELIYYYRNLNINKYKDYHKPIN